MSTLHSLHTTQWLHYLPFTIHNVYAIYSLHYKVSTQYRVYITVSTLLHSVYCTYCLHNIDYIPQCPQYTVYTTNCFHCYTVCTVRTVYTTKCLHYTASTLWVSQQSNHGSNPCRIRKKCLFSERSRPALKPALWAVGLWTGVRRSGREAGRLLPHGAEMQNDSIYGCTHPQAGI